MLRIFTLLRSIQMAYLRVLFDFFICNHLIFIYLWG
jgi:hypothetical protein